MRTLYLCYFGLREPLVQTQVLPYLRQLAASGIEVSLLTFEPEMRARWSAEEVAEMRSRLAGEEINWHLLPYHKRPSLPATLYDIAAGALLAAYLARAEKVDVFHARAHVPLAMALLAQRIARRKTIFDIRGLVADEYVDAGLWKEGSAVFRAIKWLERAGIKKADQTVVLTERMKDWLIENYAADPEKIEVIPCCTDSSRYVSSGDARKALDEAADRFEVIYAGSVTGLYLLEEMGEFFLALRDKRPNALLRILTPSPVKPARERLLRAGLEDKDFWLGAVAPDEVPRYLSAARVGLSFRKATFSQIAASPTKIPEYLAAGLPVVSNAGIGDTDNILLSNRAGIVVDGFSRNAYQKAVEELEELLRTPRLELRCKTVAEEKFGLAQVGGARYRRVYERLERSIQ